MEEEIDFDLKKIKYCVYYNAENYAILDILPKELDEQFRSRLVMMWSEQIPREILLTLSSNGEMSATQIREIIGHSSSTLHENIKKLEEFGLVETEISYVGNKQRMIKPKVLFISKNPKFRRMLQRFFQGLYIEDEKMKKILGVLNANPDKYFTADELSLKTGVPADEIELLLSTWDSQLSRSFTDFLKKKPFEKKTLYKAAK
ncbi:MAG: winged helix-turn-helix transcriptional regulator [Candidatus Woesearchaeota archaeon]